MFKLHTSMMHAQRGSYRSRVNGQIFHTCTFADLALIRVLASFSPTFTIDALVVDLTRYLKYRSQDRQVSGDSKVLSNEREDMEGILRIV
jgi:hypothetical protein